MEEIESHVYIIPKITLNYLSVNIFLNLLVFNKILITLI